MKDILFFTSKQDKLHLKSLYNLENYNLKFFDTTIEGIANIFKGNDFSSTLFVSDDINFLQISFRLYNQTFNDFIYLSNEKTISKKYDQYNIFLITPLDKTENIIKPIYLLGNKPENINIDFKKINNFEEIQISQKRKEKIQKVFYYENKFLITEFIDFDYKIITLDDSVREENLGLNDFFLNLDYHLIKYMKYIFELLDNINIHTISSMEKSKNILDRLFQKEQEKFIIHFKFLVNNLSDENIKNYLCSYLVSLKFFNSQMFSSLVNEITNNTNLTPQNKYFLFWQYIRLNFVKPIKKKVNQEVLWKLYRKIYSNYETLFENIEFIPKEQRNKNLIFIFINQFLNEAHAPTKNLLDIAYSLIKDFNKEVLIINTAEILTKNDSIPFFGGISGNKIDQYSDINQISFKDISIPFYQSAVDMPNENEMLNILNIVHEYKPYFVLSLGIHITADLTSNLVSTISFPTTSDLTISQNQIHIKAGKISEEQKWLLKLLNVSEKSIIPINVWKNNINLSKVSYAKKDFNLPEDKFLLSIVGNRLNEEVTEEFLIMLFETISYNTHIVFIGSFNSYSKYCKKYSILKDHSTNLGYQENLYDVLKLFDLFVNPPRIGGGIGGLWSLMNSIPIITLDYGDVYSNTNGNFGVKSYEEMKNHIISYSTDKEFYENQSKLAYSIYHQGKNMKETLDFILNEIEVNPYFN